MLHRKSALEIFRMAVYVFFPIGVFYTATHPDMFLQRAVEKERKEYAAEYYKANTERIRNLEQLRQNVSSRKDK